MYQLLQSMALMLPKPLQDLSEQVYLHTHGLVWELVCLTSLCVICLFLNRKR